MVRFSRGGPVLCAGQMYVAVSCGAGAILAVLVRAVGVLGVLFGAVVVSLDVRVIACLCFSTSVVCLSVCLSVCVCVYVLFVELDICL